MILSGLGACGFSAKVKTSPSSRCPLLKQNLFGLHRLSLVVYSDSIVGSLIHIFHKVPIFIKRLLCRCCSLCLYRLCCAVLRRGEPSHYEAECHPRKEPAREYASEAGRLSLRFQGLSRVQ